MERFFEEGTLTRDEMVAGPEARRRRSRSWCPLVCTSALTNVGIQPLLDAIVEFAPSPADRAFPAVKRDGSGDIDGAGDRCRALLARSSGAPSPIPSPAASRCSASSPARSSPTPRSTTSRAATSRSGSGHLLVLQGKTTRPGARRSRPATSAPSPS